MLMPSNPRFRIYTRPKDYYTILRDFVGGRFHTGNDCRLLEEDVCRRQGIEFAHCVAKARVGIYLAVSELASPGHKVVLSPYTLSDVINMVICAGAIPVFADIQRETCNIDPEQVERLIDDQTDAVLVTHLHGLACDMPQIKKICAQKGVKLIEDAAQAFGTHLNGRQVGTFGDAGIYSFGMYKNVNSFFGGMIVTPHRDLFHKIRQRSSAFPWQETGYYLSKVLAGAASDIATYPPLFKWFTFWIFRFAFLHDIEFLNRQVRIDLNPQIKYDLPESYLRNLTPLQARLIRSQLDSVDEFARKRIQAAEVYHQGLRDIPDLVLPPLRKNGSHGYTHFPLQVPDRPDFLRYMVKNGRDVAIQHLKNCADEPCFREFYQDCPNARATAGANILLSTYPRYGLKEVAKNVRVIRSYFSYV